MNTEYLINVDEYCACNDIDVSFISSLQQTGLIEITTIEEARFLDTDQLQQLERYIRFYYELNINLEGIESIKHLLQRVNAMHKEIISLHNKIRLYEDTF
jgi:hypothetical protein